MIVFDLYRINKAKVNDDTFVLHGEAEVFEFIRLCEVLLLQGYYAVVSRVVADEIRAATGNPDKKFLTREELEAFYKEHS
jgi:hypothetical protein